jgi:hypothetical protein
VSQNSSSTLSFDPCHLDAGYPGQFPAHHRGLGQRLAGPPFLTDGEVIEPFALVGVSQRPSPLGDGNARPPLRATSADFHVSGITQKLFPFD